MVLVIDNYDSFTYNLVQYIGEIGVDVVVKRNDKIDLGDLERNTPEKIIISPGPGRPQDAGISCEVIKKFSASIPILGVCLGHQCIASAFGAYIVKAKSLMHGKVSLVYHNEKKLFKGVKNPFKANRYHSLIVDPNTVPSTLKVIAHTEDDEIMAISHNNYPIWGVQFHPESILTQTGKKILNNFLELNREG